MQQGSRRVKGFSGRVARNGVRKKTIEGGGKGAAKGTVSRAMFGQKKRSSTDTKRKKSGQNNSKNRGKVGKKGADGG